MRRSPAAGSGRKAHPGLLAPLVLVALSASSCRDGPDSFVPTEVPPPTSALLRLTFSPGDDRSPSWSRSGDSVLYTAEGFGDLQASSGVLLSIPRAGGVAELLFPIAQAASGAPRRFLAPTLAAAGDRVAYVHFIRTHDEHICGPIQVTCTPAPTSDVPPLLDLVSVRVRRPGSPGPIEDDPFVDVQFQGRVLDTSRHPLGLPGVHVIELHPFHILFNEEGRVPVRPSWAPEGDRLVFSDGLQLFLWRPGEAAAEVMPGTTDAVTPAWSPDGTWIASVRLERGGAVESNCQHFTLVGGEVFINCIEERTTWSILRRRLVIQRPDGTETRDLTSGEDPAWDPTSRILFFSRGDRIWRYDLDLGAEDPVPGTIGGREPAVSPDGQTLVFAKLSEEGTHDIWTVDLSVP